MDTHCTASQIAAGLGRSRQHTFNVLRRVPSSGTAVVSGNTAAVWALGSLPDRMLAALHAAANRRGFASVENLLRTPGERWQPKFPLNRVHPDAIARAARLRDALAEIVARYAGTEVAGSTAEILAAAIESYRRVMRVSVTPGHLRRVLERTIDRDRGRSEWQRVELYLEERPALVPLGTVAVAATSMPELSNAIVALVDPANPSKSEIELIWINACEEIARLTDVGTKRAQAVSAVVRALRSAPGFCGKSDDALEKSVRRRLARWEQSGGEFSAAQDRRADNCHAAGRIELSDDDRYLIIERARQRGGRLSQAWRELVEERALSGGLIERLGRRGRRKSYVPTSIRLRLQHEIDMVEAPHKGERNHALNGAWINRDPTAFASGDWQQADDATLPVKFWVRGSDGEIHIVRGQWLVMVDCRSMLVLGFVLIPERNYSAFHIRNLITRTADAFGLPRVGFYFERGAWKTARLLKGDQRPDDEIAWSDTETGLRGLGLKFQHALLPRGKIVEGIIGQMQNLMEGDPGYCGRNEMSDRFERVERLVRDCESGKADPQAVLWSFEQWSERLAQLVIKYNQTVQEGKYCKGRTPLQAYQDYFSSPLVRLTGSTRYLIATHRIRARVTANGIGFRFSRQPYRYKGEAAGRFIGREVVCYFSPEDPATLSFESPDATEIHTIEREIVVPGMGAPSEILNAAHSQNRAQNRYARELYRAIAPRFSAEFERLRFRLTVADSATCARGQVIADQQAEIRAARDAEKTEQQQLHRAARGVGIHNLAPLHNPDRRDAQLEGLQELRNLGITTERDK